MNWFQFTSRLFVRVFPKLLVFLFCLFHFNVPVTEMLIVFQRGWAHTGRRGTNE